MGLVPEVDEKLQGRVGEGEAELPPFRRDQDLLPLARPTRGSLRPARSRALAAARTWPTPPSMRRRSGRGRSLRLPV